MDLDKAIDSRESVREFKKTKHPDYKQILEAINAALKAPIAGNLPSIKFILVTEQDKIKELANAAQQKFIADTSFVVVVCSDKKFLEKYYYDKSERYMQQQAGAAIENFLLKIVDQGLASCWIGAFSDETVRHTLKIPDNIDIEAILPIGYEQKIHNKLKHPKRQDLEKVTYYNTYKNKRLKQLYSKEI